MNGLRDHLARYRDTFLSSENSHLSVMPSLHLACDELTMIVRCLNSNFRAVSIRRPYDIVRFLGVAGSP